MTEQRVQRWTRPAETVIAAAVVVAALYFTRDVLIPIVLAIFLAFLLSPVVRGVQSIGMGRAAAVFMVVVLTFSLLGVAGWFVGAQAVALGAQLPDYRFSLVSKARALGAAIGERVRPVSQTIGEIKREIALPAATQPGSEEPGGAPAAPADSERQAARPAPPAPEAAQPVAPSTVVDPWRVVRAALLPVLYPFVTIGLTAVLTVFFLIYREDLRDRIIRALGNAHVGLTTSMLTDAGSRFSRYFSGLVLVNGLVGAAIAAGLLALSVPGALLFGILAALLRFIPFLGPWVAAAFPISLSLAVFDTWTVPLLVTLLFVLVELIGANFLEPWLYAARAGASATAVILSMIVWTWLWGAVGLLLATPITVCLVVLGKYVPQLQMLDVLLGNEPVLEPHVRFYQRLLALDSTEAAEVVRMAARAESPEQAVSRVVIPALSLLAADQRAESPGGVRATSAARVIDRLLDRFVAAEFRSGRAGPPKPRRAEDAAILVPLQRPYDDLAARALARLFEARGGAARIASPHLLIAELLDLLATSRPRVVRLVSVSGHGYRKIELLCKRIVAARPDLTPLVGVWDARADPKRLEQHVARIPGARSCPTLADALREMETRCNMSSAVVAAGAPLLPAHGPSAALGSGAWAGGQ